ncbi:MAG: peptidoglycan DD-metalloendopeptidase family protein [Patescibacteria group bacterium]|jgi:hypothetical protein
MRPHPFIHVAGIAALVAIIASLTLAYVDIPAKTAIAAPITEIVAPAPEILDSIEVPQEPAPIIVPAKLGLPMTDALRRVTKKTFGMEVHPETSPVQNDRFDGYHVGVDFETDETEQDIDVVVSAICDGPLLSKNFAKGYGGFALQSCVLDGEDVIITYGHLDLENIEVEPKQILTRGERIGVLGKGHSRETDGVRKHLHLGIHRGTETDIRGYVQKKEEIEKWLDVLKYLTPSTKE